MSLLVRHWNGDAESPMTTDDLLSEGAANDSLEATWLSWSFAGEENVK